MNTWFTSDTHFYHKNIVEFQPETRGGYTTCEEMSEKLIENWNKDVKPDDMVYHVGDFCFGGLQRVVETIPRLNGRITLVLGNHDHHVRNKPYLSEQFHNVTQYLERKICGQHMILFHNPTWSWNHMEHGSWHIHGHVHGHAQNIPGKIMDVGIDTRTDLRLYHFDEVKAIMDAKQERYRHRNMVE